MSDHEHNWDRRSFLGVTAGGTAGAVLAGCKTTQPVKPPVVAPPPPKTPSPLDQFQVSETVARKVMARAMQTGGDFCDLFFQRARKNYLGLEDSAVNRAYYAIFYAASS